MLCSLSKGIEPNNNIVISLQLPLYHILSRKQAFFICGVRVRCKAGAGYCMERLGSGKRGVTVERLRVWVWCRGCRGGVYIGLLF